VVLHAEDFLLSFTLLLYKKFSDPTALVLVFLAVLGLYRGWIYTQRAVGIDYYVAWTVADAIRNDGDYRIYDRQGQNRLARQYRSNALAENPKSRRATAAKWPFPGATASPFLYSTVAMLSTSDYENSYRIWSTLSLVSFGAAILLLCHLLGFSMTASLAIFVPCLFWMDAFHSDMRVANINSIQLGLLALAYFLLSRDSKTVYLLSAGALIAMIAVLKPNLAPVSLLLLGAWLIRGQGRKFLLGLAGMAAGALFALGVSSLFFGDMGIWFEWLDRLFRLTRVNMPASAGNYDILRSLDLTSRSFDLTMGARGQIALAMVICALALGFLWWGRKSDGQSREQAPEARRERELVENAQLIGMGCLVHMMVSPLVWLHYYVLAIPMLIVAFRPWSRAPAHGTLGIMLQRLLPALVFLVLLDGPHWSLVDGDFFAAHATAMFTSIVILYFLGLWQLRFQDGRLPVRAH
jgi:hypothetical protein